MATFVLLPGMDGTGDLFDGFRSQLGQHVEDIVVVRYPVSRPLGYEALIEFVRSAIPKHGPIVLLGESFSGPIAVALAASGLAPRVRALVLCCTFVRNPRAWTSSWRWLVDALPIHGAPAFARNHFLLGRHGTPMLRSLLAATIDTVPATVLKARLRAILDVDVSNEVSKLQMPILYLRALEDRLVPPSAAELIARLAPDIRVVDVEGPHCLLQTQPAQTARLVAEFATATLECVST